MKRSHCAAWKSIGFSALVLLAWAGDCAARSWFGGGPWPASSHEAVRPLFDGSPDARLAEATTSPDGAFRFVVFGDQRALADGEWQAMMAAIARLTASDPSIRFIVDTGDIVNDGQYSDQFAFLRGILSDGPPLPYLVAVGNHEVGDNRSSRARANTARALSYLDPAISAERLYYRKDIGPLRFLFLDSNDLVYGDDGKQGLPPDGSTFPSGSRAARQMDWLAAELAGTSRTDPHLCIVAMHHPFIQSSAKHRDQAEALWNCELGGRRFPQLLLESGVDLVLAGHTHTYERFRLGRGDGRDLSLVNFSGRPRGWFLWFGREEREARMMRGGETEWLRAEGWGNLEGWTLVQEESMLGGGSDQFGLILVEPGGKLVLEVCYLDSDEPQGFRRGTPVVLHAGYTPVLPGGVEETKP